MNYFLLMKDACVTLCLKLSDQYLDRASGLAQANEHQCINPNGTRPIKGFDVADLSC